MRPGPMPTVPMVVRLVPIRADPSWDSELAQWQSSLVETSRMAAGDSLSLGIFHRRADAQAGRLRLSAITEYGPFKLHASLMGYAA